MLEEIISLSKQLIAIPSESDNLPEIHKAIELVKKELHGYPYHTYKKNNYPSLLFANKLTDNNQYKIIFNAHLDVVHGDLYQYTPIEKDGKLYGRGAYDMKAATATMILLFKELAPKIDYPLALQIVTDEELSSEFGTQYQLATGLRGEFIITGEGTNQNIIARTKGLITAELTTNGKSAHSGYPWLGDNAITKMHAALDKIIKTYPTPKQESYETIVHVTGIHTKNVSYNKIPTDCTAYLDIRFIAEDKDIIIENIKSLLPKEITMRIICTYPANDTNRNNTYLQLLEKSGQAITQKPLKFATAHGTSDLGFFKELGCTGIEFGPKGGDGHGHHEWVDIQGLDEYYQILKNFLQNVKE
jgi:succinyl-diaminopimelate desuccinylase